MTTTFMSKKEPVGMLREVGKKDRLALRNFVMMHLDMKPTAFSYATEKMKELREIKRETKKEQKKKLRAEKPTKRRSSR